MYCLFQVLWDCIYICKKVFLAVWTYKNGLNKLMFLNYWSTWLSLFTTKSLSKCNVLEIFQPNYQFRPMKIAPTYLFATETKLCKFFAISVFSNWLCNSQKNPRNARNFWTFENLKLSLSSSQRLYLHIPEQCF